MSVLPADLVGVKLDDFGYVTFADVVKARDGDTTEIVRLEEKALAALEKREEEVEVVREPALNALETGVPWAAEAKAMYQEFVRRSGGRVMQVALTEGGSTSGVRRRWHTLCMDPVSKQWFSPAVRIARAGYATPFSNPEEWKLNGPVMVAAQLAMRDGLGMWSNPDPRFRVACMFNPAGSDVGNEYVDIFNDSDDDVPIGNWSVRSDGAWGEKQRGYPFPPTAHILPRSSVRVWVGRKGANTHDEFFWGNLPDAPLATFKNLNEDIKSGGMAILMRPLPDMTPAAWHVWPNRLGTIA